MTAWSQASQHLHKCRATKERKRKLASASATVQDLHERLHQIQQQVNVMLDKDETAAHVASEDYLLALIAAERFLTELGEMQGQRLLRARRVISDHVKLGNLKLQLLQREKIQSHLAQLKADFSKQIIQKQFKACRTAHTWHNLEQEGCHIAEALATLKQVLEVIEELEIGINMHSLIG